MRKVVAFEFLSLDGVADGPDRFFTAWDDVVDEAGAAPIATQDAVIPGRRSYDEWAAFWPSSDVEPFATFVNRRLRRARSAACRAVAGPAYRRRIAHPPAVGRPRFPVMREGAWMSAKRARRTSGTGDVHERFELPQVHVLPVAGEGR